MSKKRERNEDDLSQEELIKLLGLEDDPEYSKNYSSSEISEIISEMENDELQDAWDDFDDLMLSVPKYLEYLSEHIRKSEKHASVSFDFSKDNDEQYVDSEAFSDDSLQRIEGFFLDVFNEEEPFDGDIDELILAVGLYLGEAAVVRLDGEWVVWDKKDDVDYGKPVVAFWVDDDYGLSLNPFEMVVILMETKTENTLFGSLNAIKQALV